MRPQNKIPRVLFGLRVQIYNKKSVIFKGLAPLKRYLKDRSKIKLSFIGRFHLFHPHKLQIQVVNQRPDLFMDLRGEVLRDGGEGGIGPGIGCAVPADEPVGNVDVVLAVFGSAVLLEEVGHFDAQVGEFRGFLAPGVVAVNVREGGDGTALQDVQPGIQLGLSAGGQPDELGDEAGTDDGGLFAFDEGHGLLGEERQEVLAEEALRQRPFLRELVGVFEEGVYPGDSAFGVLVLDAVAGLGVVFHDFAGTDAALNVNLVEDDGAFAGDADAVFVDEAFQDDGVEEGGKELCEIRRAVASQGLGHDVFRERVHFVHRVDGWTGWTTVDGFVEPLGGLAPVFGVWFGVGVVLEVLAGGVVVAAAGFMVASAYSLVQGLIVGVNVEGEAALAAAIGAGVAGGGAGVFLEVVFVVHTIPPLSGQTGLVHRCPPCPPCPLRLPLSARWTLRPA